MHRYNCITLLIKMFLLSCFAAIATEFALWWRPHPSADVSTVYAITFSVASYMFALYIIFASDRPGKTLLCTFTLLLSILGIVRDMSLSSIVLTHSILLWTNKSIFIYAAVYQGVMDFLLSIFAAFIFILVLVETHHYFLSIWAFFLTHLFALELSQYRLSSSHHRNMTSHSRFESAYHRAQTALAQLSATVGASQNSAIAKNSLEQS